MYLLQQVVRLPYLPLLQVQPVVQQVVLLHCHLLLVPAHQEVHQGLLLFRHQLLEVLLVQHLEVQV